MLALSENSHDVAGNIIIGELSYQRWLTAAEVMPVSEAEKSNYYAQRAAATLPGEEVGSSAGGEQPKFTCYAWFQQHATQLLVKFTLPERNENSQRWRELLRSEALALQIMNDHGMPAARTNLIESEH